MNTELNKNFKNKLTQLEDMLACLHRKLLRWRCKASSCWQQQQHWTQWTSQQINSKERCHRNAKESKWRRQLRRNEQEGARRKVCDNGWERLCELMMVCCRRCCWLFWTFPSQRGDLSLNSWGGIFQSWTNLTFEVYFIFNLNICIKGINMI